MAGDRRIPVVDVGGLHASERSDLEALAAQIGAAAREVGFFSIVNHGVPEQLVADVFDLGADEHAFAPHFANALGVLRLLRYPPHPGRFDERLYGAAPHTDYGNLTLLAQDDVGGLEVRMRDGTWVTVEPEPGAFVCNIGDALMRWSNDVYVSNPHRVVNRSARERYSVALFGDPNADALIACLPACAGPDRPAKYPPITYAELLRSKYEATYTA